MPAVGRLISFRLAWQLLVRRATLFAAVLGCIYVGYWWWTGAPAIDVHAYWSVDLADPYRIQHIDYDAFFYSPPFALLVAPLHLLPFPLVAALWRLALLAAVLKLAGRWALLFLLFRPVILELGVANVQLLIALAIVAGFRWPAAWSFVLITKPTCGVDLLWFAVRREWRALGTALLTTAVICVASFAILPQAWFDYAAFLRGGAAATSLSTLTPWAFDYPILWVRLPFAIAVALIGAWRGWRWSVLVAAWLALPIWYDTGPAIFVALPALLRRPKPATEKGIAAVAPASAPA